MGIWVNIWVEIFVFGSKYWYLGQNMGIWVKSGWYGRSGLVVRSSAHKLKVQVRFPPPPLWDPCGIPVGSNLCASRRRTLRGLFFAKKSVLKLGIVDFLDFNKKCQILIIPVDLGLCTGYNLCASRRRTLRGLFFTKNSVLKLEIVDFLDFNNKNVNF